MSDKPNSLTDDQLDAALEAFYDTYEAEYFATGQTDNKRKALTAALIASGLVAENDRLRGRLRETTQILVAAIGADGPCDAEEAAKRIVAELSSLRERLAALVVKWRGSQYKSSLGPLYGAGCADGTRWCAGELDAAIAASQKDKTA